MIRICALVLFLVFIVPPVAQGQNEILIGLIPEENIFSQMERHRPLAAYLSAKLGSKVRFTILSRYGDVVDRFLARRMDGAFFGVFTGMLALEKLEAEPVVHPVNLEGSVMVKSYIFVRKNSGIKGIRDMKGKRIAFVDRATMTGYIYALAWLRENGVRDAGSYFREFSFTGSHGSTVFSVLDGRADIGVVKSKIFHQLVKKDPVMNEELDIIRKSGDFPDATLFLRKDLPGQVKTKMKEALLNMDQDPEGKKALETLQARKFVEAAKKDFRPFYETVQKAGITIKTYKYR
jgi:phosphonate transport system substrate-binding protein